MSPARRADDDAAVAHALHGKGLQVEARASANRASASATWCAQAESSASKPHATTKEEMLVMTPPNRIWTNANRAGNRRTCTPAGTLVE
jgi:hypothetical protein